MRTVQCSAVVALVVAGLGAAVNCGNAQGYGRDASVSAIVTRLRTENPTQQSLAVDAAAAVLAQKHGALPAARVDSIAQALVSLAIEAKTGWAGSAAISAFVIAGQPTAIRRYAAAFDRLLEIYRRGTEPGVRGAAFKALARVGPVHRALPIWRETATLPTADSTFRAGPAWAIELLCDFGGTEGRQILRDLHRTGAVTERHAANTLAVMIQSDFKVGCKT